MKKLAVSLFVLSSFISNAQPVEEEWKFRSVKAQFESIKIEGYPLNQDSMRIYMLEFVNEFRKENGVKPLQYDSALNVGALNHAVYIADKYELTHLQTDTASPYFTGHCPSLRTGRNAGENAARNSYEKDESMKHLAYDLFKQWRNSPGHRRNMLFGYKYFGFGVALTNVSDDAPEFNFYGHKFMAVQTFY